MKPAPLTKQLEDSLFGGKAAQLAAAKRAGLPVPAGVALPYGFVDAVAADEREARQQLAMVRLRAVEHGGAKVLDPKAILVRVPSNIDKPRPNGKTAIVAGTRSWTTPTLVPTVVRPQAAASSVTQ